MRVAFSPQRSDATLAASVEGDVLTVNGTVLDFSTLGEGEDAVIDEGETFLLSARRVEGDIDVVLILPYTETDNPAVLFPKRVRLVENGMVPIPSGANEP